MEKNIDIQLLQVKVAVMEAGYDYKYCDRDQDGDIVLGIKNPSNGVRLDSLEFETENIGDILDEFDFVLRLEEVTEGYLPDFETSVGKIRIYTK